MEILKYILNVEIHTYVDMKYDCLFLLSSLENVC